MEEKKTEKKMETQGKNMENNKSQSNSKSPNSDEKRSTDRVLLNPESHSRTEQWLSQIGKHHQGVRVTRNDVVNFILLKHTSALSDEELSDIGRVHFDEIRFYSWAVKTVREARARGQELTVAELEKQYKIQK